MRSRRPVRILCGYALVADVPDELVIRRVEHFMQRDGELDHAKACAKMAAGHRDGIDGLLAELGRELRQVMRRRRPANRGDVSTRSSSGVFCSALIRSPQAYGEKSRNPLCVAGRF